MRVQKSPHQKQPLTINAIHKNVDSESGTTYSENPAYGWVFAFWGSGLFIEVVR